jgi:hypothetical protein
MPKPTKLTFLAVAGALFFLASLGCSISDKKNGDSEDVKIATPVGGLKVQTNIDPKEVGLALYPGARIKPSEDSDHDKSANVNMNTPFFHLKVIALDYLSDDPPSKVLDFYKKDMARYGKVLECDHTSSRGGNVHSNGGMDLKLECDDTGSGDNTELKAGAGEAQHIVGVSPNGKGTEFGLVYIQLRKSGETI